MAGHQNKDYRQGSEDDSTKGAAPAGGNDKNV